MRPSDVESLLTIPEVVQGDLGPLLRWSRERGDAAPQPQGVLRDHVSPARFEGRGRPDHRDVAGAARPGGLDSSLPSSVPLRAHW